MDLGMTLPVMEPDLWDADGVLEAWSRAIDEGPWSSLCFGERIAFANPDALTLLGAVAAWTSRARLVTTVLVPQLHDPVLLAKALATADRLSSGRLTVGLGVGGRDEDYASVSAPLASRTMGEMAARVAAMRAVWAGERPADSVLPVGPAPVQPGGPPLLVGTLGPRTIRSAAAWADGLAGMSLTVDLDEMASVFELCRTSWADAGRPAPRVTTSFWFALGEAADARAQVHRHLRHYMNWVPPQYVDALAQTAGFAGSVAELRDLLRRVEDLGCDEVQLIPTSSSVFQVEELAELLV
ncbi:LLM class flavin-dependent oxidoreductase [Nocardioides mangrovi]|uniref:LLM class flavin-dependent oxidoreductase n=1 Tax=Nocardioides mangrovi TaxID=2874580 RepID=A0ABS7UCG1_9ACTN|nr:LLM class flavin-dependent oxidoreductase [Nocardioides mangrovi]MBZ5738539.1 LLM class flavin-dependent oxidoreductase [Nocardioides mangrovi]